MREREREIESKHRQSKEDSVHGLDKKLIVEEMADSK